MELQLAVDLIQRQHFGPNVLAPPTRLRHWAIVRGVVTEPMFVLLVLTTIIYLCRGSHPQHGLS